MDAIIPFRWCLSSQKLKKLNSCFNLRKYLFNVMNIKWYLLLGKKSNIAYIKVVGTSPLKSDSVIKVYIHIAFFQFDPLTRIDSKKLKISKCESDNIISKSAALKKINQRKRLVVKGKIKLRNMKHENVGNKSKSVIDNNSITTLLPNNMPTCNCNIQHTIEEELKVKKQDAVDDKCIANLLLETNKDCKIKLSKDLETMYNSCTYSDVIIICQSQNFRAHKAILEARCPALLLECIKDDPDETKVITKINIDYLPVLVVKTLLFYIYTGQLEAVTLYLACDLIYAANIYHLNTLKDICMKFLANSLSDANAIFIYSFSYSADELLKSLALNYIVQNFSSISNSTIWEQLKRARPDLSTSILSEVVRLKTPPMIDLTLE